MVSGTKDGQTSTYTFNALGYLVSHNEKTFILDYTSQYKNVIMELTEPDWLQTLNFEGEFTPAGQAAPQTGVELLGEDWQVTRNIYGLKQLTHGDFYTQLDRLGSLNQLTDDNGLAAYGVSYDAWGSPSGNLEFASYTGHRYDTVLGVYFAQARMYDAADKRFLASDPYWEIQRIVEFDLQGLNLYSYCVNNPVRFVDPLGLWINDPNHINFTLWHPTLLNNISNSKQSPSPPKPTPPPAPRPNPSPVPTPHPFAIPTPKYQQPFTPCSDDEKRHFLDRAGQFLTGAGTATLGVGVAVTGFGIAGGGTPFTAGVSVIVGFGIVGGGVLLIIWGAEDMVGAFE
jgi:RHS repeat-associated protein